MALVQLSNRSKVEWEARTELFRVGQREQVDLFTAVCLRTNRAFITRQSYHMDRLFLTRQSYRADILSLLTVYKLYII
jgi:hypothetical protein